MPGKRVLTETAFVLLLSGAAAGQTAGTAFTYQGRLADAGLPANGSYDLQFTLYDASTGGGVVAGPIITNDVAVTNGLFTVMLDFGSGAFRGDARWLEIGVRPGASTGAFTLLGARHEVTPAPQSLFSQTAPWSGLSGVPASFPPGAHLHDAADLASGTVAAARLSGAYGGVTGVGTVTGGAWNATPVGPPFGGTGQNAYAAGDMLIATGSASMNRLPIGGPSQVLSVSGGLPAWRDAPPVQFGAPITSLPFTITQPGAYYLTGNLTGVAGQDGVTITVSHVTLELNGFTLAGANTNTGVQVGSGLQGITVRNGTIRNWNVGINASTATVSRFADIVVANNVASGILSGSETLVSRCAARQNGDRGFQITSGVVDRSTATFNNIGITVTDGVILGSIALNNSSGIVAIRTVVENSVGSSNTGDGIFVSTGKVLNSVARSNGGDGIEAIGESIVFGNTSASNGTTGTGAGIHATGDKNHIEGNNVSNNDVGIDTNDTGIENNVVIRNGAFCNTINYDSGVNNQVGTVGSLTTIGSNPWGNLSITGFCS